MAAKAGRKPNDYCTTWGERIPGLAKQNDGRWRVITTGIRYTEADERLAVKKYLERYTTKPAMAAIPTPARDVFRGMDEVGVAMLFGTRRAAHFMANPNATAGTKRIDAAALWGYVRQQLLERPDFVATMTGLPELAWWRNMPLPGKNITLAQIIGVYRAQNPAGDCTKRTAIRILQKLAEHAQAKTLGDMTTDKLLAFRQSIETCSSLRSAGTRRLYFSQIKGVIAFGLKVGLDAAQIQACLARCKVLWTAAPMPNVQPHPISRDDFHTLLKAAGTSPWRAWLLIGLNLCLHLGEVCGLKWTDFDLVAGTFAAIREKTRRQRIPRAAILWPETLAELKELPRKAPYLFVSRYGTCFNHNTRCHRFVELRSLAGLPDSVTFEMLRDGAYTAACHGTTDERPAKVLAGHSAGMSDNYVLRNPQYAKPACDAVYAAYGPFPLPTAT